METENHPLQTDIHHTTSTITLANRWEHFLIRIGVNRMEHKVAPGLYAIGDPTSDSPVFVTANYTLSFDAIRSTLDGVDGYILVLDTEGINVWCAAGKGTFGTDELVHRIEETNLLEVVNHRVVILPQLGAPGVAAHEVKKRSKFKVEYGPVRASDLPEYLKTRQATPEMRRVRFSLLDRAVLVPVDFGYGLPAILWMLGAMFVTSWLGVDYASRMSGAFLVAILSGIVLFPLLLPWLPTRDFVTQGFFLGSLVTLPFVVMLFTSDSAGLEWHRVGIALAYFLTWPAVTAYVSFNFTGATTFTSRSGVRREINKYIPTMVRMFIIGIVLLVVLSPFDRIGG
jgi:hypothetical protein